MLEKDIRPLTKEVQEMLCRTGIRMIKSRKKKDEVSKGLGIHVKTLINCWKRYLHGGWDLFKKKKRGFRLGEGRKINQEQEVHIYKIFAEILKVHYGKRSLAQRGWLERNQNRIELVYMPAYSLDLNPDVSRIPFQRETTLNRRAMQYLDDDVKQGLTQTEVRQNKTDFDAIFGIKSFFRDSLAIYTQSCSI